MIRSCVLLFKSCLREVSGRAKTPPCGVDTRLAVGKAKRWFLFHLNPAPFWYCQTQNGLSQSSNHSLMLWAYLECKANNRDPRKRKQRNTLFSFHVVFFIFWPASTEFDLLRSGGRLSSHCCVFCSSCKRELCSAAFNREGNVLHLLNYMKN